MSHPSSQKGKKVLGFFLILIGLALGARKLGLIPSHVEAWIFQWEMILMILGVIFLSSRENRRTGWILLLIGLVFWLPDVMNLPVEINQLFWPAVILAIGLFLLFRSGKNRFRAASHGNHGDADELDEMAIFGGGDKIITSKNFKGGNIVAIFGGSKIDLSRSNLAEGQQVLDLLFLFGGSTLYVPKEWEVKIEVVSILGGFSDKRIHTPPTEEMNNKTLVIKGLALFGGGELRN